MRRTADPSSRGTTPPTDIYDDCFTDFEEEDLDKIAPLSPKKAPPQLSRSSPSTPSRYPKKASNAQWERGHNIDPRDHDGETFVSASHRASTSYLTPRLKSTTIGTGGPVSEVRRSLFELTMASGGSRRPPTPTRLFQASPTKGKQPQLKVITISDGSDVDPDQDEVSTDVESPTEGPSHGRPPSHLSKASLASLRSVSSTSSEWSVVSDSSTLVNGTQTTPGGQAGPSRVLEFPRSSSVVGSWAQASYHTAMLTPSLPQNSPEMNQRGAGIRSAFSRTSSMTSPPLSQHPPGVSRALSLSSMSPIRPKPDKSVLRDNIARALRAQPDDTFLDSSPAPSASPSVASEQSISTPVSPTASLEAFLTGPLGVDLKPCIIAHDARVQRLLDKAKISWGVQYELARGVSKGLWRWCDVELKIQALVGSNKEIGYKVPSIMKNTPRKGFADLSVWEELDREQAAILEDKERGLGLMGEWMDSPKWYGGQVQHIARIVKSSGSYKIHLEPLEKRGRSYRLARYLGSRRVLQVKVPDDMMLKENQNVKAFLAQKFILCGRVYVPLCSKDNGVYMVETDQDYERDPVEEFGDHLRKSFGDIVRWHNDLALNKDQPISKWVTRFALAFSNSVPVIIFEEENINSIPDEYASGWDGRGKAPADQIVTDGCGFINKAALHEITNVLGLATCMTAVQGRICGGKGLWILHPIDTDTEPKIWIRKSQSKITHTLPLDRAHRIFDLLTISRASPPASLTRQSIMNVWYNGVPEEVLVGLMESGLREQVELLMQWDGPHAMHGLWSAINTVGKVARGRLARVTAGLSRALGLNSREWGHEDIGVEEHVEGVIKDALEELTAPVYTGRNEHSGAPVALYECAVELVQAGFRPDQLKDLRDKLKKIIEMTIQDVIDKFQIPLPQSLSNFIIPDPLGILEENEVYYRSSQPLIDPETRTYYNVMTGPVLIGRYPVRLPSDIQKLTAVNKPELFNWCDVLIVSVKGKCSVASLLAGGDYDGDEEFIIPDTMIVEPFQNKPLTPMPPNLIRDNFEKHVETVTDFAHRVMALPSQDAQIAFQEVLLLGLTNAQIGLYSKFHDYAVWKFGYDDPRTIRLAYIFNTVLDSSKTGYRLKPGVFEKDRELFGGDLPETSEELSPSEATPFIFHSLRTAGQQTANDLMSQYDQLVGVEELNKDADLRQPYKTAADHALDVFSQTGNRVLTNEMDAIRAHVNKAEQAWGRVVAAQRAQKEDLTSPRKKRVKRQRSEPDPMLRVAQMYAEDLPPNSVILFQNIREIKASYAYELKPSFGFAVAFRDLCVIKAHASKGGIAPIVRSFDEAKSIPAAYTRALTRVGGVDRLM